MPPVRSTKAQQVCSMQANHGRMLNVFRHLTRVGHYIVATTDDASFPIPCDEGKALLVLGDEIERWRAEDLIEKGAVGYVLSAAGRAWLKRQLALADAFQEQHQARAVRTVKVEGVSQAAIVNDAESPLAWLASRKDKHGKVMLAPFQFAAGERLRSDYHYAGLTAKVTANWDPAAAGKHGNVRVHNDTETLCDNVMAARQRVVQALAVVGPELSGILVDVCCHLRGLEDAEKAEGWPQRSGKVVLQLALSRLARHYGLISDAASTMGLKRKLQHWGTPDYRPQADAKAG
jgi:hypothetical protein